MTRTLLPFYCVECDAEFNSALELSEHSCDKIKGDKQFELDIDGEPVYDYDDDELPVTHCPLKTKQDEKDSK